MEADKALAEELLADQKERAEHLMLVDLSRNDLSKVCVAGSVDVTQFMEVERFSHIMHLVSTVVGRLAPTAKAYDVLKATFPAGTLSGAPKPRALRLLDELEPHRRGIYGGVVGYLDFAGDMDMAIAIRSALLREGRAYVQAGGGIVADSGQPHRGAGNGQQGGRPAPCRPHGRLAAQHHARIGSRGRTNRSRVHRGRLLMAVPAGSGHPGQSPQQHSGVGPQVHAGPAHRRAGAGGVRHHHADLDDGPPGPAAAGPGHRRQDGLQVQGSKAATTVTALALVALAGGLAASIAGKIARWIITAIIVLAAAGIIAAAATVLADPLAAAQGSIAAATGVTGSSADVSVTAFPVLAVVAGSLLALGGLLVIPAGRYWKTRTKYDTAAPGLRPRSARPGGRDRQLGPALPRRRPHLSGDGQRRHAGARLPAMPKAAPKNGRM